MFVFTLLVIGLLCIAFKSTRLTGIAGLTLLSLVHPLLFASLLVIGGVIYFFYYTRVINMSYQNYLIDAIETVAAWDFAEDAFADAVTAQACLMAGINADEIGYLD